MANKKHYSVNEKSKTVSFDFTELTAQEQFEIEMLVKAGYKPTKKRSTGNGTKTKEFYLEALKDNKEALDEFKRLCTTVYKKDAKGNVIMNGNKKAIEYKGSFLRAARYANSILEEK